jgi:hypothetical protein
VGVDAILSGLGEYFSGKMLETNARCVRRGFEETRVIRL